MHKKYHIFVFLPISIFVLFITFAVYLRYQSPHYTTSMESYTFNDGIYATQYTVPINTGTSEYVSDELATITDSNTESDLKNPVIPYEPSSTEPVHRYTPAKTPANDTFTIKPTQQNTIPSFFSDVLAWLPNNNKIYEQQEQQINTAQLEIYTYGNALGEIIKDFGNSADNQLLLMSNFLKDPGNTQYVQALERLAEQYETLSDDINTLYTPSPLKRSAYALSAEYANIAEATRNLSEQRNQDDLLREIYAYNKVGNNFAEAFIKLSGVLRAYGVKYDKGDPGDIFMPPNY